MHFQFNISGIATNPPCAEADELVLLTTAIIFGVYSVGSVGIGGVYFYGELIAVSHMTPKLATLPFLYVGITKGIGPCP